MGILNWKLGIGDWGLGNRLELVGIYTSLFLPSPAYSRRFKPIPAHFSLFQSIPVFQFVPTYFSLFQLSPACSSPAYSAYSSLFQPIPSYSSLNPNPQSPIPSLQFEMPNCAFYPQLDILSVREGLGKVSKKKPLNL